MSDEWTQDVLRYWERDLLDSPDREVWARWFARHGVDPDDVAIPGLVIRDVHHYRLHYQAHRPGICQIHGNEMYPTTVVFQLEGPPLPFPETQHGP